jgi:acetyl esterase/lipase
VHVAAVLSLFFFRRPPPSAPSWFAPLHSVLGVAALLPLARAVWELLRVRGDLKRVALDAGLTVNALHGGHFISRTLGCLFFPVPWAFLARGTRSAKGSVYAQEPAVSRPSGRLPENAPTPRVSKLRADVMLPPASAPEPTRAFLYFHGGAWVTGSRLLAAQPLLAALSARGWLVATADYRHAPRVDVFTQARDVRSCARWLKENYPAAARCLVIAGESAGGHLALLAALEGEDAAAASGACGAPGGSICEGVVALCAVTDFTDGAGSYAARMGGADHSMSRFIERFVVRELAADAAGQPLSGALQFIRASPVWRVAGAGLPDAARAAGLRVDPGTPLAEPFPDEIVNDNTRARLLVAGFRPKPRAGEHTALVTADVFYAGAAAATSEEFVKALGADTCRDRPVPPTLVVTGANDTVVPATDSIRFFRALSERRQRDSSASRKGKDALAVLPLMAHASIYALSERTLAVADLVCDWADAL